MKYFDAHTHVQFAAYDADRKETVERALKAGVSFMNVGTQADTSAAAVKLANDEAFIFSNSRELEKKDLAGNAKFTIGSMYASVGLHPIHTEKSFHDSQELGLPSEASAKEGGDPSTSSGRATEFRPKGFLSRAEIFDYDYYKKLALDPKTVAIGECGLDYYRTETRDKEQETRVREKQKDAFIKQIELAHDVKKPLMIHCRNAFQDLIGILVSYRMSLVAQPGVVHFFSGTVEDTKKLLNLGFSFTFGGVVTFPPKAGRHAGDYDEIIKMIPLDRILSETDAPYVAPAPYRGKRNEPLYVIEVVRKLAEIKNVPVEEMAERIFENARRIFNVRQ